MYKGGTIFSKRSQQIFNFAELLAPVVLLVYGVLIKLDIIKSPHYFDSFCLLLITFLWLCLGIVQFLIPIRNNHEKALRLIIYHILAGSYLVFISGITSPFLAGWLLLMIASYIDFSNHGLQLSALSFIAIIVLDICLWGVGSAETVIYDLLSLAIILTTSIITASVTNSQKDTRTALDVSRAQESLQRDRMSTIVNNLADAVISTDKSGVIRVYNAASLDLLNTNDSLDGHHIDDVLPVTDQKGNNISLFNEFQKARTVVKRDDLDYTYEDGEQIRLEITLAPIRNSFSRAKKDESRDGYIIIMRDITKAKSLEEERDEFISVTSHELRTPITIAEGTISNVQIMLDHPDVTGKMLRDAVNLAHDQIMYLANMVNDLSTLSRAERGVSDAIEDIDLLDLAHKLHEKYNNEATKKKLQFNLDLSPRLGSVQASRLYLEEVLQNFITNSIKYTKEGGITLIIERKTDTVKFAVKDTGIGISKSDQTKVFNKFWRSEDYRTRETSGTGLGLYIAAKLARKLNAKITLTSRLNFGSTFSFILPVKK